MKIILTGGTGFIGGVLRKELLSAGHTVVLLSRAASDDQGTNTPNPKFVKWDGRTEGVWCSEVDGADAVINLAGESLASGRWTKTRKENILRSRVDATKAVVAAIKRSTLKPKVLVNASAVGYYGNVEQGEVSETHPKGNGFLADVCDAWEKEARQAEASGVRVVRLRFGVVLGKNGGALQKFITPFRLFIGGPLGSGRQWFPWVHRDDVLKAIVYAVNNPSLSGPVNVTAPEAATMRQFCAALGKAMHRPSWAPVPPFVLKIMLGEMSEMILDGQRAVPESLQKSGFDFKFPALPEALRNLLS